MFPVYKKKTLIPDKKSFIQSLRVSQKEYELGVNESYRKRSAGEVSVDVFF